MSKRLIYYLTLIATCTAIQIPTEGLEIPNRMSEEDFKMIETLTSNDEGLNRYKIVKKIGAGGYGLAFLAEKIVKSVDTTRNDPDQVVIKIIADSMIDRIMADPSTANMIEPESEHSNLYSNMRALNFLKKRRVPLIQTVLDTRQIIFYSETAKKSKVYSLIVMEYGSLGNLEGYTKQLKFGPMVFKVTNKKLTSYLGEDAKLSRRRKILDIIHNLLLAVYEVNRNGIIHGDIKPINIFVRETETGTLTPFLGDWDLAYLYKDRDEADTQHRYTLSYRPPEMSYFNSKEGSLYTGPKGYKYTGKEDIFALGVSLVQICNQMKALAHGENDDIREFLEGLIWPFSIAEADDGLYYIMENSPQGPKSRYFYNYIIEEKFKNLVHDPVYNASIFFTKIKLNKMVQAVYEALIISSLTSYKRQRIKDQYKGISSITGNSDADSLRLLLEYLTEDEIVTMLQENFNIFSIYVFEKFMAEVKNKDPIQVLTERRYSPEEAVKALYSMFFEFDEYNFEEELKTDLEKLRELDEATFTQTLPENMIIVHESYKNRMQFHSLVNSHDCKRSYDDYNPEGCDIGTGKPISFDCMCYAYFYVWAQSILNRIKA